MEWYVYAALGMLSAILSFLMDLSVSKLLTGTQTHMEMTTLPVAAKFNRILYKTNKKQTLCCPCTTHCAIFKRDEHCCKCIIGRTQALSKLSKRFLELILSNNVQRPTISIGCFFTDRVYMIEILCVCVFVAHQWLYSQLEGNSLLQFFCWTLYPACLCAISASLCHNICPFSTGQSATAQVHGNDNAIYCM